MSWLSVSNPGFLLRLAYQKGYLFDDTFVEAATGRKASALRHVRSSCDICTNVDGVGPLTPTPRLLLLQGHHPNRRLRRSLSFPAWRHHRYLARERSSLRYSSRPSLRRPFVVFCRSSSFSVPLLSFPAFPSVIPYMFHHGSRIDLR